MATARKPALKLVQPNLEEMERVLVEAAKQQAPMISRSGSTKAKFEAEAKELEAERMMVLDRQKLVRQHFDALDQGFEAELADIDKALGLYTGGLTRDDLAKAG